MEPVVVSHYKVFLGTEAIANIDHHTYRTIAFDINGIFLTKQSTHSILEEACLQGGADYNGRIKSIRQKFKYFRLTPLAIDPDNNIFAFPTSSPKNKDSVWIFDIHVHSFKRISKDIIEVTFESGHTLEANISKDFFKEQMENTSLCARHMFKREY